MKTALTIAGSDSSGGAGIQADIKTMTANGVFAMSAITALTAQNTTGVTDILEATPQFLGEELDGMISSIAPHGVYVELPNTVEGLIRMEDMPEGEYDTQSKVILQNATTGRTY